MSSRLLMGFSAALQFLVGLGLTFAPQELLAYLDNPPNAAVETLAQLAGAVFLGFAMLNWMSKAHILGGIYGRPITMGNFLHYFAGAAALIGPTLEGRSKPLATVFAIAYAALAALFGRLVFTNPVPADSGR